MTQAVDTDTRKDDFFTRSLEAMPPGSTVQEWMETTREGQFVSTARGMSPAALNAWLEIAYLLAPPAMHPDAELIAAGGQFIAARAAYVDCDEADDPGNPIGAAYDAACDAIDRAEPTTIAGIVAMAQAAKASAPSPDGEDWSDSLGEMWARRIINALVRLHEEA